MLTDHLKRDIKTTFPKMLLGLRFSLVYLRDYPKLPIYKRKNFYHLIGVYLDNYLIVCRNKKPYKIEQSVGVVVKYKDVELHRWIKSLDQETMYSCELQPDELQKILGLC